MFMSSQKFFGALAEKNNGGNGDMEVSAREFEGGKRSCRRGNEKEEKERNEKKGAGQRDKGELKKKEWWVVGLGRAWHVENQNLTLTFFFFFFFNADWDVTAEFLYLLLFFSSSSFFFFLEFQKEIHIP